MTKEELVQWLSQSKMVDGDTEFDESGNCEEWRVYERDGELFRLEFLNGRPCEKWGDKGYIRGVYEPKKVIRKTKMVEVVWYHEDDEKPA